MKSFIMPLNAHKLVNMGNLLIEYSDTTGKMLACKYRIAEILEWQTIPSTMLKSSLFEPVMNEINAAIKNNICSTSSSTSLSQD